MKPVLFHLITCTICPATYTMLLIFVNGIRWIFHSFTCKVRELIYATSYIHNYSNMNKYFRSCWLYNGIVANAFCSLVKCIKRNVIIGFFIYNISYYWYYNICVWEIYVYKILQRIQQSRHIKLRNNLNRIQWCIKLLIWLQMKVRCNITI